jgi:hypothetical protein
MIVQIYFAQTARGVPEWYADPGDVVAGLVAGAAPTVCLHTNYPTPDHLRSHPGAARRIISGAVVQAATRTRTLCYNRVVGRLDGFIIAIALLFLSVWPLLTRYVMQEALDVGRVLLIVWALFGAVQTGKALTAWRVIDDKLQTRPWQNWPYFEALRVGAPSMARATAPKRKPLGGGLQVALILVAISMLVIVPPGHVAVLPSGRLQSRLVSLMAGPWELYQVEWEGTFVLPLVDAGDDKVWVYVVAYKATAEPGAVTRDWVEWTEGVATQLTTRVLNGMWQERDPSLSEDDWRAEAAVVFGEADMMSAFEDVITERVEEAYEITLSDISVTCELWTIAEYIKEVQ